jgi:phosphoglycolate phosphatase-like HAD superfamily hydrolase
MNRTIEKLFGIAGAMEGEAASHFGMTDPQLLEEAYRRHHLPEPPNWPQVEAEYHKFLADDLKQRPGHAIPGAKAFIQRMAGRDDVALALGTGNFRQGAYLKLAAHQMAGYFPVGGFGEDGPQRNQVMARAMERANAYYGQAFDHRTVIIGDTPLDIEGAHKSGVPCLSVASGHYSVDALSSAGADMVVPNLAEAESALYEHFAGAF